MTISNYPDPSAEVPLRVFADFVAATGLERVRVVDDFKKLYSQPYSPVTDWWHGMRTAAAKTVRDSDTTHLAGAVSAAASVKQPSFTRAANGIDAWFQRDAPTYIENVRARYWSRNGIDIKVRPDFIVKVSGDSIAVKLWFRTNPGLNDSRCDTHLFLMGTVFPEYEVGVLEAQTGDLHVPTGHSPGLDVLLSSEAAAFAALWVSLP